SESVHATLFNNRVKVAYVTGSHAFAVGMLGMFGAERRFFGGNSNAALLQLLNGVPRQITVYAYPYTQTQNLDYEIGTYVQDQWPYRRVTLSLGGRLDFIRGSVPAQHVDAINSPIVSLAARDFAPISNTPNWKDASPRMGAVFDVFGDGRTAIKGSINKYVE